MKSNHIQMVGNRGCMWLFKQELTKSRHSACSGPHEHGYIFSASFIISKWEVTRPTLKTLLFSAPYLTFVPW